MVPSLANAQSWLLNSGVYILDKDNPQYGAVFSYYDRSRNQYQLTYAEATGYVISLLRYLTSLTGQVSHVEAARASGDWLVSLVEKWGPAVAMGFVDGRLAREAYAFDSGICCKGLVDLYDLTGDLTYLTCAEKMARWLVDKAINDDGSVKPVF